MNNPSAVSTPAAHDSSSTWQKQPAVVPTHGYEGWALLEQSILEEDPASNSTGLAVGTTSDGQPVRVSLRFAEPPASSYVQLHTDANVAVEPTLYAADSDLLLFHMATAVVRDYPFASSEHNLFVYKAHPNPEMGWLRRLPPLADGDAPVRYTGIACRGKDYVVAGFRAKTVARHEGASWDSGEHQFMEVGELSRFSSSTDRWDIIDLPMPFNPEQGLYKFVWDSDAMFAFDGIMFWVDYHRGMLLCDVFAESPSLQFIKLPGIHVWDENHDYSQGRQLPQAYRKVGISRGKVKFIDIDDGLFGTRKTSGFVITTWSLDMTNLNWVKDSLLEVDELWLLPEFRDSPLPRWVPEYPVVSRQDSNILHCILRGPRSNAKTWVITLDMREKVLKSYIPFVSEQKLDFGWYDDMDTRNIFCDTPFICCDFGCLNTAIENRGDNVERKWETTRVSRMDSLEVDDASARSDDMSVAYFSDCNVRIAESCAMHLCSVQVRA